MARLTYTDEELTEFENLDCPVKDTDIVNKFCEIVCDEFQSNCPFKELGKKLKAYEDKEEQGLLIELPCKVGDTLYYIDECEMYEDKVRSIDISKVNGEYIFCVAFMDYKAEDFGKIVFRTKAEAEEALAKMGECEHE